jgi:hypothetical protein
MTAAKPKPVDELRMNEAEFDRMMGAALRVKPEDAKKPKRRAKPKAASKKRRTAK